MDYKKLNNIFGWVAFLVALVVYYMTAAKTASFWDCGEFISCAFELQVPHPPGPPVYLLLGRVFSMFSIGDLESVAFWVNMMSVLSSAFTVLFTFWIVTHLAKKMISDGEEALSMDKTMAIMFSGLVGALACCFADSVWFNAVEAEVYAMSSLCTAAVVWLMLKWEARADQPDNLKWIVFIAFVVGLSIGVHLLNLLAIPALAFIYYFKKYEFSWPGAILTFGLSIFILGFIQYGIIQYFIEYIWSFEKFLVGYDSIDGSGKSSGLGLPIWTGMIVAGLLFVLALGGGLYWSHMNGRQYLSTALLSLMVIMTGYSTYTVIVIRANTDVPINENDPSNPVSLLSYMKREQYGDRPLFYGPLYNAAQSKARPKKDSQLDDNFVKLREADWFVLPDGEYTFDDGTTMKVLRGKGTGAVPKEKAEKKLKESGQKVRVNRKGEVYSFRVLERYAKDGKKTKYEYPASVKKFFPRMYSTSHYDAEKHTYGYANYVKNKGADAKDMNDDRPTASEDMKFFFDYQIRHMYWRYFMWQFAGRATDNQDDSWEDGFLKTSFMSGKWKDMPEHLRNQQGRNHFFFLPFILGLLGLVWHFFGKPKDASWVLMLFLFTGLAIIVYLNQPPSQPRERDYSYAGSFQTFAIWIGLGVLTLYELMTTYLPKALKQYSGVISGTTCLLLVPAIMAAEGWDDHNRHHRYIAPDSAYNLLNSCEKNAILFTNGDNDTFPLWYLQEVEDVRTDVRVVNLSLLNTDWYIAQMKKQANLSPPLPITMKEKDYYGEKNAYKGFKNRDITLPVDKQKVLANGTVKSEFADKILSPMPWKVRVRGGTRNPYLLKQDYMILNIMQNIADAGWNRPVYFSSTIPPSSYMGLTDYFQVEGLAYRVTPIERPDKGRYDPYQYGFVDKERSYELITNKFRYRGLDNPSLYLDEHIRRTIIGNIRSTMFRTANSYIEDLERMGRRKAVWDKGLLAAQAQGNTAQADSLSALLTQVAADTKLYTERGKQLLDFMEEKIPESVVEADPVFRLFVGNAYFRVGEKDLANEIYLATEEKVTTSLKWSEEYDTRFRGQDRYISGLDLVSRYYEQAGNFTGAVEALETLFGITGNPQLEARIQQARAKAALEKEKPKPQE